MLRVGDDNAAYIVTQARVGYRLAIPVERVVAGRQLMTSLALQTGQPVPWRGNFQVRIATVPNPMAGRYGLRGIERPVSRASISSAAPVMNWRRSSARHVVQGTPRNTGDAGIGLCGSSTWNFQFMPMFLECEYGGEDLLRWTEAGSRLALMHQPERPAAASAVGRCGCHCPWAGGAAQGSEAGQHSAFGTRRGMAAAPC